MGKLAWGCLLLGLSSLAFGQVYLPRQNGAPLMPDDWLLGRGQAFHHRVAATGEGRKLEMRAPTDSEQAAIDRIRLLFQGAQSKAILLGDGDRIVHIETKPPVTQDSTFLSASVDKSVTAFSAGIAVCEGKITLGTKARDLLPELAGTDIGETTLRDNLMMASGTTTAFDDSQSLTTQEQADLAAGRISLMDYLKGRLGQARASVRAGERFDYKSQDPVLVGMMVSAAYGLQGRNFRNWQSEHFFPKVRVSDRRVQGTDRFQYAQASGNSRLTLADWARLAVFVQESRKAPGCYGDFVREATTTRIKTDRRFARAYGGYGYFVWTENAQLPQSYSALGYGGQAITWSTTSDKYVVVFGNATGVGQLSAMTRLWFDAP